MGNKWWLVCAGSIVCSLLAIVLSMLAMSMANIVSQGQSDISEIQQSVVSKTEMLREQIDKMEATLQEQITASRIQSTVATKLEGLSKRVTGPAIRMPTVPVEVSSESLDAELEQASSTLLTMYPSLPEAIHVVALMRAQTRQYGEAKRLWEQCVTLAPKNASYYINLASSAIEQGDYAEAVETLNRAQSRGVVSSDITYHLAISLPFVGKHAETLELARREIEKNPADGTYWLILAQSQLETNSIDEAEASFRRAMDLGVRSASLYLGLGNACMRLGKKDEAREHLRHFSEMKSDKLTGQERFQILTSKETRHTALSVFSEAAIVHFRNKNALQAEHLLNRCVAIAPMNLQTLRSLADLYYQSKKPSEERAVRERILELGTTNFSDFIDLAKVCAVLGDMESAEAVLKQSAAVLPLSHLPFAGLSEFYLQNGRLENARWYAQQAIERQPSPDAFRFLAGICKQFNDKAGEAEALKFAEQLQGKKP